MNCSNKLSYYVINETSLSALYDEDNSIERMRDLNAI